MPVQIQENTEHLLHSTAALGGVGLLVAENEKKRETAFEKAREQLLNNKAPLTPRIIPSFN